MSVHVLCIDESFYRIVLLLVGVPFIGTISNYARPPAACAPLSHSKPRALHLCLACLCPLCLPRGCSPMIAAAYVAVLTEGNDNLLRFVSQLVYLVLQTTHVLFDAVIARSVGPSQHSCRGRL